MGNKAKVYRMVVEVIDFEDLPVNEIIQIVEDNKWFSVHVHDTKIKEITDWNDDHPLNKSLTHRETFRKMFE